MKSRNRLTHDLILVSATHVDLVHNFTNTKCHTQHHKPKPTSEESNLNCHLRNTLSDNHKHKPTKLNKDNGRNN